ncbi:MAG: hypothetical protein JO060_00095 [Candidatus Eremiobacteraeota bacterium]|nr:hypothetical protein [Candidatus Eremiobacteraeota bacterium]MBV9646910.1 hypothetical protein [Candidatus Eremiobacteraeota bacterium]
MTFDPWAQLADMQKWMADNFPSYKAAMNASPLRYQAIDPTVQEIGILATMHNMASMLQDSGAIKAAISAAIKERAESLRS